MIDPENPDHYNHFVEILESGYEIFYSNVEKWLSEDTPEEKTMLVLDVLGIYRIVEDYKCENPEDTDITKHEWGHFLGFDGNEETEYMMFAIFLIKKQGTFAEQRQYESVTNEYNSHYPTLDKYRKMVKKWCESGRGYGLSKKEILAILDA